MVRRSAERFVLTGKPIALDDTLARRNKIIPVRTFNRSRRSLNMEIVKNCKPDLEVHGL